MPNAQLPALRRLAAGQGGLVTRDQALGHGVSYRSQRLRIDAGQWRELLGSRVLMPADADVQLAWALALRFSHECLITGPLALRLQGQTWVAGPSCAKDAMAVVSANSHVPVPGIVVIRDSILRTSSVHDGLPVADVVTAVLDCAMYLDRRDAEGVVDRALLRGVVSIDQMDRGVLDRAAKGRGGSRQLRSLARAAAPGARSPAERRAVRLLRAVTGARWAWNYAVVIGERSYVLDAAEKDLRLCVEIDGRAYHIDASRFEGDRARQNALILNGWLVLRFTWAQLTQEPSLVVAQVQRAVDERRAALGA